MEQGNHLRRRRTFLPVRRQYICPRIFGAAWKRYKEVFPAAWYLIDDSFADASKSTVVGEHRCANPPKKS